MVNSKKELMDEYRRRAEGLGLKCQVLMDGSFTAQIAVVGEGAGETEVRTGQPFTGGSGHKLWSVLRKIGVSRMDCYVTNTAKRQISLSTKGDARNNLSRDELRLWSELLIWELSQLPNLRYVVVMGNSAHYALRGIQAITEWRGSVLPIKIGDREVQALLTFNPAHVLRQPQWEILFDFDMNKLKMLLDGTWEPYPTKVHINPSFDDAMDWLLKMRNDKKPVSFDIETTSSMETACWGFGNDPHEAMCIGLRTLTGNRYPLEEEIRLRQRVHKLVSNPNVQLIAQNGSFDFYWSWYKDGIKCARIWYDTLLAHHTLYSTLPHNLGALTAQYTTHPYYKDEREEWKEKGDLDGYWTYNGKDCCITLAVQRATHKELRQANLNDFFFDHVMRLQEHLVRATVYGVGVDTELKEGIADALAADVDAIRERFIHAARKLTGEGEDYSPNPGSWQQLKDLFFARLGLVGRGQSTDETNRQHIKSHPGTSPEARNMIQLVDNFKKEHKFLTTYARMKTDTDGRIRCEYKQYGTQAAPGRLSSAGVLWGTGGNLQNQPTRAYEMFIADPGCGFGYFDLSQAEARYVGWRAAIPKWIDDFERAREDGSYDCHRALASDMWGIPYDDVPTKDETETGEKTLRFRAKRCRHGLNYRMGPFRLADTTGLTIDEAREAYSIYHRTSPEVQRWWDVEVNLVRQERQLFNQLGRRLIILEKLTDEALESIIAFKPQSTIGDWVCQVWYLSEDDPEWPARCRVALNIHDALIAHGPVEDLMTCLRIMKKYAERPMMVEGVDGVTRELIIPADCKMTVPGEDGVHRWSTLKGVDV